MLHGNESIAFGDAGYQGIGKRPDAKADVIRYVAMRPGKRRALTKENAADTVIDQAEKLKVGRMRLLCGSFVYLRTKLLDLNMTGEV